MHIIRDITFVEHIHISHSHGSYVYIFPWRVKKRSNINFYIFLFVKWSVRPTLKNCCIWKFSTDAYVLIVIQHLSLFLLLSPHWEYCLSAIFGFVIRNESILADYKKMFLFSMQYSYTAKKRQMVFIVGSEKQNSNIYFEREHNWGTAIAFLLFLHIWCIKLLH